MRASSGAQVRRTPVDDASCFQANDRWTGVFTAQGEAPIRAALKERVARLDPERVRQVPPGTIVNLAHVASIWRDLAGRVPIVLRPRPGQLPVSRALAHRSRQKRGWR